MSAARGSTPVEAFGKLGFPLLRPRTVDRTHSPEVRPSSRGPSASVSACLEDEAAEI